MGNRFETLFLPSGIILVEGVCEHKFVSKALELAFPSVQFSVINASSDGRMKEILSTARSLLGDLQKSPYRARIVPVLDSVHEKSVPLALVAMGIDPNNIVVWSQNGIEFVYPPAIIDQIFGVGADSELKVDGDVVEKHGIRYKKAELAENVALMVPETVHAKNSNRSSLTSCS